MAKKESRKAALARKGREDGKAMVEGYRCGRYKVSKPKKKAR